MDRVIVEPQRARPARPRSRSHPRWSAGALILLLHAVFGCVGGVYLTTTSIPITAIAAGLAAIVVAMVLITQG
jgi:hypothetical protein